MGRDWLLPLYDPLTRALGLPAAHRELISQAGVEPGHRVLEIGSGTGNVVLAVKQMHPEAEAVGLDPDPKALARGRRKAAREDLDIHFDRGFAEQLPYPDESFDRVLSAFMFHHLEPEGRRSALREAARVLRPGGSLHLLDFGADGHGHGPLARRVRRDPHLQDNSPDRVLELITAAGLTRPRVTGGHRMLGVPLAIYRAAR